MLIPRLVAIFAVVLGLLVPRLGLAETEAEADAKAAGRTPDAVKKQEKELLPPKDVLEKSNTAQAPDAYQPKGVDLGLFLLLPKLEVDETWLSNVFATQYDAVSDYITAIRPEIALNSRMERHSVTALTRLERKEFRRYKKESVTNGFAQLSGRYDIGERDNLNAMISYVRDNEDRGSPDNSGGNIPTEYHYLTFNGSGAMVTGQLTSVLGVTVVNRDWEDVGKSTGVAANHFRNRTEYEQKLRESYEFRPGYSALLEGVLNQRVYQHKRDGADTDRDSMGWRASSGLGVDLSDLVRGDFLLGYFRQDYADGRYRDSHGPFVKASFNWTPTRLTTIVPTLERSVEESTATGVSSLVRTAATVMVRHELMRNWFIGGVAGYAMENQIGGSIKTKTHNGLLRSTYLFTPNFYLEGEVGTRHKLSNTDGGGFVQNTAMFRLGAQY